MVAEEDEDVVVGSGLEHLLSGGDGGRVTGEDGEEVFGGDILARVVLLDICPDVDAGNASGGRRVEHLARERVARVGRNVVVQHRDDLVGRDAVRGDQLVGMSDIGLVTDQKRSGDGETKERAVDTISQSASGR